LGCFGFFRENIPTPAMTCTSGQDASGGGFDRSRYLGIAPSPVPPIAGRHVAVGEHPGGWAIDGRGRAVEDGGMTEVTSATPRRSGRMFHKMRVQAQGRAHDRKRFKETCETVVVNAHGGLLLLKHEVDKTAMLVITNPETLEEQECRVVYMGDPGDKGQRVGIEFLTPAPRFWGVEFPSEPAIQ